jgi:ABC-2 type transport system ATP-binding protein
VESSLTLRRELRRIVDERGLTALVTSHDMDVIEDVCDRVIIVNDGRVVADDAVDSLLGGLDAQGIRVASPDLEGAPLRAVRDQFEVREVRHQGDHTSVEVTTGSDGFYELVALLRAHDVTVSSVDTIESDLESAFLEVTRE